MNQTNHNQSSISSIDSIFHSDALLNSSASLAYSLQTLKARPMLFGAGQIGRKTLSILRAAGIEPLCFVDDTIDKQGQYESGVPILSLSDALSKAEETAVVIVCLFTPQHRYVDTKSRVLTCHADAMVFPFFTAWHLYQDEGFECYFLGPPSHEFARQAIYREIYDDLIDEESRNVLISHLQMRLMHDASIVPTPRTQIPFFDQVISQPGLVYVDGGAFDGDTVEEFLVHTSQTVQKIFAFEPDEINRLKMQNRLQAFSPDIQKKISIRAEGIWKESGVAGFNSSGNMGSAINCDADSKVSVIALDDLLEGIVAPVLIKLDVEGAEMDALAGMRRYLQKKKPSWAISVYHKPADLVDIYQWLKESGHEYRYALRCHGGDGADLVLYAW